MKNLRPIPLLWMLLAVIGLSLTGCSDGNITVAGLNVESTGITRAADGSAQLAWRLRNPNVIPYLVVRTTQRIYLNNVLVGTATDAEELAVPPGSVAERVTPLVGTGPAGEQTLAAASAVGSAAYRTEASLVFRLYGDETDKATLTSSGTLKVSTK